ncbi:MAG: hypothetical protein JSV92_00385 [archaeon]|nr:MAG: hypothetical protein JSV92_00385 [archaeon]
MLNDKTIGKYFNLLLLHVSERDVNKRSWVVVIPNKKFIRKFKDLLKDGKINENYSRYLSHKNKFPLVVLKEIIDKQNPREQKELYLFFMKNVLGFSSNSSKKIVKIPLIVTPDLLYLMGVLIGDGCVPNSRSTKGSKIYRLSIEKGNEYFIKEVWDKMFFRFFNVKGVISKRDRDNKPNPTWEWTTASKPIVTFFDIFFEISRGSKSHKIRIPELIRKMSPPERLPFIIGLMDTDWGHHGGTFGTGVSSKELRDDTVKTLKELNFSLNQYEGILNNKFPAYYARFNKQELKRFWNFINEEYMLKNPKRINFIKSLINK